MQRQNTWASEKAVVQHYRRRSPERSELYRVVYHARDELERVWEPRFQAEYGGFRRAVGQTLDSYLNCGLLIHGAARVYCTGCQHSQLVAFSCKKRGVCPSCASKRAVKFAEHLYDEVLESVPHRHVVFSVPKRLRSYFRYDRVLGSLLFQAAWSSLKEGVGIETGNPGLVLTLQTAGDKLNWNPHLHGLLSDRLFGEGGRVQVLRAIDLERITRTFAEKVLGAFAVRELISDEVMSQILSQEHSGFSVWVGEPFTDAESARFVARYVERGPLSLERLSVREELVVYQTKDGAEREFEPLEFLALLSSHIPNFYESVTRFYGHYSCRARGERRKRGITSNIELGAREQTSKPSSWWAACIKRIYEIDPLQCPKCGGTMRIVGFVQNPVEIKKMMQSLGLPDFTAPPSIEPSAAGRAADEYLFLDEISDCDT